MHDKPTPAHAKAHPDAVETTLASALERASLAGAWEVVGTLAAELAARRVERNR